MKILKNVCYSIAALSVFMAPALAQDKFPSRTIEIVVPSGAGGGQDTLVRMIQPQLEKDLGVSIRVTNVSGGAHSKGIIYSHNAEADGHLIHCESPSGIIADIFKKMPFRFTEEFVPVARMQADIGVLWTGSKGKFNSVQEMIDFAKKNPGKVTVAIASPGGVDDAGVGYFAKAAGIQLAIVPVESGGERMASVIANHIDMMYEEASAVGDMMKSGNLRPLVVFRDDRIQVGELKDTPAAGELGLKGLGALGTWRGFAVKKGTPQPVIDRWVAAFKKIYDTPEYQNYAKENGLDLNPGWMGPEEFGKLWKDNEATFREVFVELGRVKPE
ncbi:MAG: tripartite tricarboxylate transporter substrate binding protein [Methylobacteriaceae bacterium]|jgi:tripartite-type tricarboxylate transporter receptor subunit TctC|nr:tripartite tricarboxylate transporter substrate binding protein [Methylobacteriaceae bacterium]